MLDTAKCSIYTVAMHGPAPTITAAQIKRGRKKLGLTRQQLAERIGVCPAAIGHWETGIRYPQGPARVLLLQTLTAGV